MPEYQSTFSSQATGVVEDLWAAIDTIPRQAPSSPQPAAVAAAVPGPAATASGNAAGASESGTTTQKTSRAGKKAAAEQSAFWDKNCLNGGEEWELQLHAALASSYVVVPLVSQV